MKILRFPSSPTAHSESKALPKVERDEPPMLCELEGFLDAVQETRRLLPELPADLFVRAGCVRFEGFNRGTQRVDVSVLLSWIVYVRSA